MVAIEHWKNLYGNWSIRNLTAHISIILWGCRKCEIENLDLRG